MADLRTLTLALVADIDKFKKGLDKADSESRSFSDKLGNALKKGALAFAALGGAAIGAAGVIGKQAIDAASDFNEEVSKSEQLFGDAAKEVQAFADTAATALGQNKTAALGAASNFAIFGKAAGKSGQDLVDFSTDFVTLASDLASFNNTTPEDAIQALGAALRGESEPIRRFGVLLNEDALKAQALKDGIVELNVDSVKLEKALISQEKAQKKYADAVKKSGVDSIEARDALVALEAANQNVGKASKGKVDQLTQEQKILAAYNAILEQTTSAQGDFERTSDGLANRQRILKAEFADLKTELGQSLLPIALDVFRFFADTALPAIKDLVNGVKDFIERIDFDFIGALKTLKKVFEPVLKGLISAFNDVRDAIERNREKLQPLFELFKFIGKYVGGTLVAVVLAGLGIALTGLGKIIGGIIDWLGSLSDILGKIADAITTFIDKIQRAIDKAKELRDLAKEVFSIDSNLSLPNVSVGGGRATTIVNNITVKGGIDDQRTAREIVKVIDKSKPLTGVTFAKARGLF